MCFQTKNVYKKVVDFEIGDDWSFCCPPYFACCLVKIFLNRLLKDHLSVQNYSQCLIQLQTDDKTKYLYILTHFSIKYLRK